MGNRSQSFLFFLGLATGVLWSCTSSDPAPPPVITSFDPLSAPASVTVIITGANFSGVPLENDVRFNGVKAAVTISSGNEIRVTVPEGANSGVISVTVNGQSCVSSSHFTFNPIVGTWRMTGTTVANCVNPADNGLLVCSSDCPSLIISTDKLTFTTAAETSDYSYSLEGTKLTFTNTEGTYSPTYVLSGDLLTLVYPPDDCSVTETYKRI